MTENQPQSYLPPDSIPAILRASLMPTVSAPPTTQQSVMDDRQIHKQPQLVYSAPPAIKSRAELTESGSTGADEMEDDDDVDDDVTRALLAAAAGITYVHTPATTGMSRADALESQEPFSGFVTIPVAASSTTTTATAAVQTKSAAASNKAERQGPRKKRFIRTAAGITWEDASLVDWDPSDFRLFCGDLGNEVTDDVLTRAFNRYPSFQRARVVRDKRTGKTKGYGFVSFTDPLDFTRAMREMNGKYVGNRPIKLKRSDWRNRQIEVVRKKDKEKKKLGLKA